MSEQREGRPCALLRNRFGALTQHLPYKTAFVEQLASLEVEGQNLI